MGGLLPLQAAHLHAMGVHDQPPEPARTLPMMKAPLSLRSSSFVIKR